MPIAKADAPRKSCADPTVGERLADSCEGRRELALKSERREHVAALLAERQLASEP